MFSNRWTIVFGKKYSSNVGNSGAARRIPSPEARKIPEKSEKFRVPEGVSPSPARARTFRARAGFGRAFGSGARCDPCCIVIGYKEKQRSGLLEKRRMLRIMDLHFAVQYKRPQLPFYSYSFVPSRLAISRADDTANKFCYGWVLL